MAMELILLLVLVSLCTVTGSHGVQKRAVQAVVPVLGVEALRTLAESRSNMTAFMGSELDPFLIERVAGTAGNVQVREHIVRQMSGLGAGWHVALDSFVDSTPFGRKSFANVIATLDPRARRRLVLACHYDSKYFANFKFVGATDSAVPCAMLINAARVLNNELKARTSRSDTTLQLIFFDGEEAFVRWSSTDSTYGSRHLAAKMAATAHPSYPEITQLAAMDAFVLLDLLGYVNPVFPSFFSQTKPLFQGLQSIESRLQRNNLLTNFRQSFFTSAPPRRSISDDHVPFLHRGVPILHLIPPSFPRVWHNAGDTKANLDVSTIDNLNRILRVFVAEYLDLQLVATPPLTAGTDAPAAVVATPPLTTDAPATTSTSSAATAADKLPTVVVMMSSLHATVTAVQSVFGTNLRSSPDERPVHVGTHRSGWVDINPRKLGASVIAISVIVTMAMVYVRNGF